MLKGAIRYIVGLFAARRKTQRTQSKGSQMRIIAPLILALFGAAIGLLVNKLFTRSWLTFPVAAIIGGVSAFFGLVVRDALDATLISNDQLFDSLFAALMMSLIISLIAHIITSYIVTTDPSKRDDS